MKKEVSNKEAILACFGKGGIDEEKYAELRKQLKKESKRWLIKYIDSLHKQP